MQKVKFYLNLTFVVIICSCFTIFYKLFNYKIISHNELFSTLVPEVYFPYFGGEFLIPNFCRNFFVILLNHTVY
jgi:hypothetical protein